MDFIRRAIRGAAPNGTRLETFPLQAFLTPLELHKEKPWTCGMKRYADKNILLPVLLALTVDYPQHQQATVYGERQGRDDKPTDSHPNGWHHGNLRTRVQTGGDGINRQTRTEQSVTFNQKFSPILKLEYIRKSNTLFLPFSIKYKKHDKAGKCMLLIFTYPQLHRAVTTNVTDNIFKNEEGMPTPPRVERLAGTTPSKHKVQFRTIPHKLQLLTRKHHDIFSFPGRGQTETPDPAGM